MATANTSLTVDNASLIVNGLASLNNSGNNFAGSITVQNNGSLSINNVLNVTRAGGNQIFGITVNTGCSLTVNSDMNWTSSSGTVNNTLLTVNGSGTVTVNRDLNLTSTGGPLIKLQFNNTSIFNVIRDINYTANAGGLEAIELNNATRLRIGRNTTRGATPYGSLTNNIASTVEFNGSVFPQTTGGDAGAGGDSFLYTNVVFNNTSPATPQITIGGATTINGNLTMTAGVVRTTASNILNLINTTATTIGSFTCFVDGPMTYEVATNVANTVRNFPIGKSGSYRPAVLTVTHSDNTSVIYTAEHFSSSAAALGYTLPATVDKVSNVRYWQIDRPAVANFTTGRIRLYYGIGTGDGVTDFANLTVVKTVGAGAIWFDIGGAASGNGSGNILSGAFATFSKFTIANKLGGTNPLPVELKSFEATALENEVDLKWITASEVNSDYFSVERSKDGFEFAEIVRVKGAGTKSGESEYHAVDKHPLRGLAYYRLKQNDLNHQFSFSKVIVVDTNPLDHAEATVFPNPSNGSDLNIQFRGFEGNEELGVSFEDSFGSTLLTLRLRTDDAGENLTSIKAPQNLASGIYIVRINTKKGILHSRVIVR